MKNPFAYRRTPSPNGEPLRLKKNPFSYTEANRLKVHTVAFSEVLLSRLCRLLLSRMSTPWRVLHRRLVASRQSPSLAQRLLASRWSPTPTPRHVSSRGSLSARRMVLTSVTGPSSFEKTLDYHLRPTGRSYIKSSLHREIPIRPDVDAMRWGTLSPLNNSTHLRLRLKVPIKGSLVAFLQDPLITIRWIFFASWRRNVLFRGFCFGLTPSH